VEVLTSNTAPTNEASLQQAREKTSSQLSSWLGKTVRLRGYQSNGYLLSTMLARRVGSVPVKPAELTRFQEIEQVIAKNRQKLLAYPGVMGVRPGYLFRGGWITDEPCIVVVVNRKLEDNGIDSSVRLPESIDGVHIDVANATPVQQLVAQAAQQGSTSAADPINPEGFALPSSQAPATAAEVFSAELVRESRYVPPDDITLEAVRGPFKVTCHASPDAGWTTLAPFLSGMKSRLTIAMYDFTAPHIMRTLESAAASADTEVSLILDPSISLSNGDEPNNPKSGDFTEDKVRADIKKKLKGRFEFVWAAVTRKGKVEHGIFPTAYHIKVAVRDGESFWLSSGNWQSSNQPDIDPLGKDRGLPNVQKMYNREWHVIVNNPQLADTYERFIKYDETQAEPLNVSPQSALRPDLVVSDQIIAEAAAAKYFAPKDIDIGSGDVVQPLLTPDNYADHILPLISSAKNTLYFQNQYIKINVDESKNPPQFAALVDALRAKIDDGVDVRIILRDIGDTRPMLEALKTNGFDMSKVRLQTSCHNKGIIVDGEVVALGSHNWSGDGTVYNRDASLIFFNRDVAQYYQQIFLYDWNNLARQKVSAETEMPQLAMAREDVPEGAFRVPWDAYFGEYQADLEPVLELGTTPTAEPHRVYAQAARAALITPLERPIVAAQSQLLSSDLLAAKAALSTRYLRKGKSEFSALAASTSPDPALNVVGLGIGEKESEGMLTGLMCVRLLVRIKYAKGSVPADHMLPQAIDGLPVDVEEVGTFRALATYPDPRLTMTPPQPGCSLGFQYPNNAGRMAGTFGAVVQDASGKRYLLSNNHVLADEGQLAPGAPIFQTGLLDLPAGQTMRPIAKLSRFVPFTGTPLTIDAAIAEELTANTLSNNILYIGPPNGISAAKKDMVVHKFGRTTGYTVGQIKMLSTDATVNYGTGSYVFENQMLIVGLNGSAFSNNGDSGSLIVERENQTAVGLLFAGSATHTLANHIEGVLKAFDVTLA
jgi:phosphatidylserine/phosphatidylglycerophosphate/cardiolipin synthase-like enzyme